ncbi:protein kinase domain-containing protein [Colwellia psychrerythraea]|uniref:non-specific serine/threonine protein kinase n=1 Tax=Colwellia psychrerythraea (strain 34H / ATCC BAA-681) TaxID=167879 RepID=Q484J0_COLP3|nr:protein kinase [Colwellia psychrerythraea]AAZ27876.1 protein kinase domain protein [Colwellia psychrerythraea 34H]
MNDLYALFQKLALIEKPLQSNCFSQLENESPKKAQQLAQLLKQRNVSTGVLIEKIFSPLTFLDKPELRLGRIIDNKYKIVELIGQGGMSDVYKAIRCDGLIEHIVAVKYFSLADTFETALQMIKKEAQILAQLDHHYIASFIDIGYDDNGEPNIMMEYVQGQTLFAFLKTKPDETVLSQVYATLDEAKGYVVKQGVTHGDISLNNVLVDKNGNANIIDFDIAQYKTQ